jgi:membrane associated rhomboid family serine protease
MSTGNPDLFVICRSCGSEVSPYITECPYCGNRLRKRAPKLDRHGRVTEKRRRRPPAPSLPRLRRDEIPGIRAESRPYATITLVVLGLVGCLLWRTSLVRLDQIAIIGKPGAHWWRLITAPFVYNNVGFAMVCLGTIALYGWLLERRHGPLPVLALFALGAVGGTAATVAVYGVPVAIGGNGAALALLTAWAIPDLLALRRGEEIDGDLLGTAAIAVVVALMPLVVPAQIGDPGASWMADLVGILGGVAVGLPLALTQTI